eukprot:6198272-Pleurochrysis_carterae.AAC.1
MGSTSTAPRRETSPSRLGIGKTTAPKYATVDGDSSRWRRGNHERIGGRVLRPPRNGNKIRRPTSRFGRFLIFRGLSVRPEVADWASARCEWALVFWTTNRPTRILGIPCSGLPIGATPKTLSGILGTLPEYQLGQRYLVRILFLPSACRRLGVWHARTCGIAITSICSISG